MSLLQDTEFVSGTTVLTEAYMDGINDFCNGVKTVVGETFTANDFRTALAAAKSGANSDITSLTGLTTPLSAAQGGTGSASGAASIISFGSSATTVPDSVTRYFGVGYCTASYTDVFFRLPYACTLSNLYAQCSGSSFGTRTYTVYINGAASTLTCAASGGVNSTSDVTHSVTCSAGDSICIRIVTSGGSDAVTHTASVMVRG